METADRRMWDAL